MKLAVCAFIRHENNSNLFLGVTRKDNHNVWGLPGGKVGDEITNETLEEAIIREVKQETGYDFHLAKLIFETICKGKEDYLVYCFEGKITGNMFTIENGKVGWITKEKLLEGPFGDYNRQLFDHIKQ